ncbi:MAG: CCA tRNA nucleotidyltransferase, partial [bacterium]|nr:CCA tRNA nucleotidyltransferase [bacterium]
MYDELIEKIKNNEAFLVGGYMRDYLLGKTSIDRDIAIKSENLKDLCLKISDELKGAFVELDSDNEIYRVVFNEGYIDFAKFENLEEDINRRDFTINSIMFD